MTETVLYASEQGLATVTLNRPDRLNTMGGDLTERAHEAVERAADDASRRPFLLGAPDGRARTRRLVIGDPQAPLSRVLQILDRHGLLADDGRLHPDVQLVSVGDHFDWGAAADRARARREGLQLLAWLAAHPADQVVLLAGNHDLARVGELAGFDDARFLAAQSAADAIYRAGDTDATAQARFVAEHGVVTAELVARDFSTFDCAQRELVTQLLCAGRLCVAHAATETLLVCHAGVTVDDLAQCGVPRSAQGDARDVALALNAALARAVSGMRDGTPLAIPGLHEPGLPGSGEGRGIFYHRASDPDGPHDRHQPELFAGPPRRRFDPRGLPRGLTQVVGHVRDKKCRELLGAFADGAAPIDGPLRHLVTDGTNVRYSRGVPAHGDAELATVIYADGGMLHADPERYELFDLDAQAAARPVPGS